MKADNFNLKYGAPLYQPKSSSSRSHSQNQPQAHIGNIGHLTTSSLLTSDDLRHLAQQRSTGYSDRESIASVSSAGGRIKRRSRNFPMKSSKGGISKKSKTMDYTNYAYNEAVGRLKVMLADNSYVAPKLGGGVSSYLRNFNEDSGDNFSDNLSAIERPVFSDISKYLSPSQKTRMTSYRPKKSYTSGYLSASKENLASPSVHYPSTSIPTAPLPSDSVSAPVEIFSFIEKQEDYIEQLEKESKYCRSELTNLLGKVKDVINENEQLTENARSELVALGSGKTQQPMATTSPSSDSDEHLVYASGRKTPTTPRKGASKGQVQSPRYASAPNIVYEARISELEAELMQASIDLRRLRTENEELKRKLAHTDPLSAVATLGSSGGSNCDLHRKQLETLQQDKLNLEESVRQLQRLLDEAKSHSQGSASSKRYINDLVQMERSQAELEVRHLRDELDRQHERVRELQHEMARRLAEERASAERRYNSQVDQLGGDLSCQWEQVAKLQLDLERQKRYETDLKRDIASRNSQIEELKMELRANRTTFLADMAQVNAEKQSLEQDITSLRLQLDRAARETKTEAARLTAEINSLRQRLDRGDADLLHSKREVLRLNDEIANLEKELAYGELKNEIRPTKKDLDKRISEMQEKHAGTVNELEEMITSQKQLMDKLTSECKTLTGKLEDTTYKHKEEISALQSNLEYLSNRMLSNEEHMSKLDTSPHDYNSLVPGKAAYDYQAATYGTTIEPIQSTPQPHNSADDDYTVGSGSGAGSGGGAGSGAGTGVGAGASASAAATAAASIAAGAAASAAAATGRKSSLSNGKGLLSDYGLHDNDDENLKDNLGLGEKQQQQQQQQQEQERQREREERDRELQQLREQREKRERERERERERAEQAEQQQAEQQPAPSLAESSIANAGSANLAAYNTDYSAYDQQQYEAGAYDPNAYAQQQYEGQQYDYGDAGGGYDYGAADYGQSGYQYDASPATTAAVQPQSQPQQYQAPEEQQHQDQELGREPHHHLPERADHNRARAVELWGQQLLLEQSPAENPLCHNSLPRQPPARSSWSPDCEDLLPLECSISSPSLMRSSNDETCSELADLSETYLILPEEGSEQSLSPAHTTIITARRSSAPAVVQQEEAVNETVIIERHLDAHG
ncbi:calponin homology domain-containing protein DDB_G0272472 isoform X4 [Drosophila kikkawai]|uniref:Calponin homology domain-containing protein DDB_G0272472 isoform X4 n=1 Tax=Drosophila kikkawai TaxID=30033 RepID=A0A6P4ISD8_DROKI|nr:calponin homology domain-containing protein DDB_G0272472 isoform X3 [Drosophila kikkawai]